MIRQRTFWTEEAEAPLLRRNQGFLTQESIENAVAKANNWLEIARGRMKDEHVNLTWKKKQDAVEIQRIFELDAERTFSDPARRQTHVETLATVYEVIQDYHQGLGFIVAFLLLLLSPEEAAELAVILDKTYVSGYFKSAPVNYVRDAKVFEALLAKRNPLLHDRITSLVPAEAYCSKWFVGFNIHVLTFEALAEFFESVLLEGPEFHFRFGLALCDTVADAIMDTHDVGKILGHLRLDDKEGYGPAKPGSFYIGIVDAARDIDLSGYDIEGLKEKALEDIAAADRRRQELDAKLGLLDDDEIVFSDEEEE